MDESISGCNIWFVFSFLNLLFFHEFIDLLIFYLFKSYNLVWKVMSIWCLGWLNFGSVKIRLWFWFMFMWWKWCCYCSLIWLCLFGDSLNSSMCYMWKVLIWFYIFYSVTWSHVYISWWFFKIGLHVVLNNWWTEFDCWFTGFEFIVWTIDKLSWILVWLNLFWIYRLNY
jgi:hypothetical protein